MSRFHITLGLLGILGIVVVTALVGMGEPARMPVDKRGFEVRKVENGAVLFALYCANCHGPNASGGVCPPLDATSGLTGGDIGPGIAWRLEDLGWDPRQPFEYVYSVIASGRTISTRPDLYPGNRTAGDPNAMAMPAWAQSYGAALRPDQVADLAAYIVNFREAIPDDATPRPKPTSPAPGAATVEPSVGVTTTTGITVTEGITVTGGSTGPGEPTATTGASTTRGTGARGTVNRGTPTGGAGAPGATPTP